MPISASTATTTPDALHARHRYRYLRIEGCSGRPLRHCADLAVRGTEDPVAQRAAAGTLREAREGADVDELHCRAADGRICDRPLFCGEFLTALRGGPARLE